jgi:hypothetical protein
MINKAVGLCPIYNCLCGIKYMPVVPCFSPARKIHKYLEDTLYIYEPSCLCCVLFPRMCRS